MIELQQHHEQHSNLYPSSALWNRMVLWKPTQIKYWLTQLEDTWLLLLTVPINWRHLAEVRKHSHQNHPVTQQDKQSVDNSKMYNAEQNRKEQFQSLTKEKNSYYFHLTELTNIHSFMEELFKYVYNIFKQTNPVLTILFLIVKNIFLVRITSLLEKDFSRIFSKFSPTFFITIFFISFEKQRKYMDLSTQVGKYFKIFTLSNPSMDLPTLPVTTSMSHD